MELDCDDENALVFPGGAELCNGADDDCDGAVDEDFDRDGDGFLTPSGCPAGDDCDDDESAAHPGAEDVPYDGVDQDCDGADLVDVDGDGAIFGVDCDDADASAYPGGEEVPKNGADDDCLDGDDIDGDGDGAGDREFGGSDCDDGNAEVRPGVRDYGNDGVDADCDGRDGTTESLINAEVSVGAPGSPAFVAWATTMCDIDEDGLSDWIVGAWNDDVNSGRVGIWYGATSATWGPDMTMTDADTLINGEWHAFVGIGVVCADIDGDGHLDVVAEGAESNDPSHQMVNPFRLYEFYGDGGRFAPLISAPDADAVLSRDADRVEVPLQVSVRGIWAGDLDGDGAAELMFSDARTPTLPAGSGALMVIPGGRRSGQIELPDATTLELDPEDTGWVSSIVATADANGDGEAELVIGFGQAGRPADATDTGVAPGRVVLASGAAETAALADLEWGGGIGRQGDGFGGTVAVADLGGDGKVDWIVDAGGAAGGYGAVYVFDGAPADCSPEAATGWVAGSSAGGLFGASILPVPDMDGDGWGDFVVNEPLGGRLGVGAVWLLSGRLASEADGDLSACTLLAWSGEQHDTHPGYALAAGDVNGDGLTEIAVGAPFFRDPVSGYYAGKAYLIMGE